MKRRDLGPDARNLGALCSLVKKQGKITILRQMSLARSPTCMREWALNNSILEPGPAIRWPLRELFERSEAPCPSAISSYLKHSVRDARKTWKFL